MDYFVGLFLAVAVCGAASLAGFDRERVFYPTMLIVIATYYVLFAVIGGNTQALLLEALVAAAFLGAAVAGFRSTLWIVVVALAAHGVFDFVHHHAVRNDGVPAGWPALCLVFDLVAAVFLGTILVRRPGFAVQARH
jgi:hypothetical protein